MVALEAGALPDDFVPRKCSRAWFGMDDAEKRLIPTKLQVSSEFHAKPASGTLLWHEIGFQLVPWTRFKALGEG